MTDTYRIFGAELSPYSVKVRAYFRYKGIPHEWVVRTPANPQAMEEYQRLARLPLIPLVVTPEGKGLQDSTPIIDRLEELHPEPSVHPDDSGLAFLSALVEEFGDEWGNKWMFHYRWWYEPDQQSAAERITDLMKPGARGAEREEAVESIKKRMVPRLSFVGSSEKTREQIEDSFVETIDILESHLSSRPFLFGRRPAFADFGLWGQLYQTASDPTPGGLMRDRAPAVLAWVERMLEPRAEGDFEAWTTLEPTLSPLLERQVGRLFLPWSDANARALAAGQEEFRVELDGRVWEQETQKYHARSLQALRGRYAALSERRDELVPILERAGCLQWLRP